MLDDIREPSGAPNLPLRTCRMIQPPYTPLQQIAVLLRERGYAVLDAANVSRLIGCRHEALSAWFGHWGDLPPDPYLIDGGRYRRRRHSCFVVDSGGVQSSPQRAHWQPVEYNALHGGMHRWYEPMEHAMVADFTWRQLLCALARTASTLKGVDRWFVEAHQFRIDTAQGIGHPTPEGAHRDGVDLVAVFLVRRQDIRGGETRVFEAQGSYGQRFTLTQPWSLLLLDDSRVIHESTPIQPAAEPGHRDSLVVTLRAGGFLGT